MSTCCVAYTEQWEWFEAISLPLGTFTGVTNWNTCGGPGGGHYSLCLALQFHLGMVMPECWYDVARYFMLLKKIWKSLF